MSTAEQVAAMAARLGEYDDAPEITTAAVEKMIDAADAALYGDHETRAAPIATAAAMRAADLSPDAVSMSMIFDGLLAANTVHKLGPRGIFYITTVPIEDKSPLSKSKRERKARNA